MIGIDILRVLKEEEQLASKIVLISAVGQESVVSEGLALGAEAYIVKPFTADDLVQQLSTLFTPLEA